MQSSSPNWKKPSDVLKRRIVKRRTSSSGRTTVKTHLAKVQSGHSLDEHPSGVNPSISKKRQNPFACASHEKKICRDSDVTAKTSTNDDAHLFNILEKTEEKLEEYDGVYQKTIDDIELQSRRKEKSKDALLHCSKPTEKIDESGSTNAKSSQSYTFLPVDWSLKSKVRFISTSPFSWCNPLKTNEQSAGIMKFLEDCQQPVSESVESESAEAKVEFQRCCMLWMHPHIPWLKLYPRMVNDNKIGKPSVIFQSPEVQKSLLNDWTESLSSAFHMLRSGKCKLFYLCSHQFTVGFRAEGVPGVSSQMHAILTPTSRGLRQALEKEGIEFTMPLNTIKTEETEDEEDVACVHPDKKASANSNGAGGPDATDNIKTKTIDVNDEGEDIHHTNEGASSWLETLGIDKKKYKSLNPNKVMLQRDMFKLIDNRPESAILLEGAETMGLVNFLLNSRSCIPNTGDLAGVPASILAPVAFKGATLRSLQVKQGSVRQQLPSGDIQEGYSVELNGPILPTSILRLCKLFEKTQQQFTFTCSVQDTTTPFNLMCPSKKEQQLNIEDIDSSKADCNGFMKVPISDSNNGRQAIREIIFKNGLYTWT